MARKSGSKLNYKFEGINDLYSYYTLTVKVEDKGSKVKQEYRTIGL